MNGLQTLTGAPIRAREAGPARRILPSAPAPLHQAAASPPPSDLASLVEAHLTGCLARGLAPGTVAYRRVYLEQLLAWLETRGIRTPQRVTPAILTEYLVHLKSRLTDYKRPAPSPLSVKTLASEASVVRSFFSWLTDRRVLLFNPAEGLTLGARAGTLPKPILTEAEVQALLAAPGRDTLGLRDRAITGDALLHGPQTRRAVRARPLRPRPGGRARPRPP